jgi:hypothetical protein
MKKRGEAGEGEGCASERGIKVFKGKRGGVWHLVVAKRQSTN